MSPTRHSEGKVEEIQSDSEIIRGDEGQGAGPIEVTQLPNRDAAAASENSEKPTKSPAVAPATPAAAARARMNPKKTAKPMPTTKGRKPKK